MISGIYGAIAQLANSHLIAQSQAQTLLTTSSASTSASGLTCGQIIGASQVAINQGGQGTYVQLGSGISASGMSNAYGHWQQASVYNYVFTFSSRYYENVVLFACPTLKYIKDQSLYNNQIISPNQNGVHYGSSQQQAYTQAPTHSTYDTAGDFKEILKLLVTDPNAVMNCSITCNYQNVPYIDFIDRFMDRASEDITKSILDEL